VIRPADEPTLWSELPAGDAPAAQAGELVRRLGEPEAPGDDRLAAIRARITLRRGPRTVRRSFTWALVVGALMIGTTLGVAASGWIEPLRARLRPHDNEASSPPRAAPHHRTRHRAAAPVPGPAPEPPALDPAPAVLERPAPAIAAPSEVHQSPTTLRRTRGPGALVAAAREPKAARGEAAVLAAAIRKLRRDGNARGALATLDEHAASYPRGELGAEADLVRVEALLAIGDRAAALRLLDARADTNPRARQALLVRGELRAAAGRCADAVGDLSRVLASAPRDGLDERALYARASCLSRLHDYPAARRDLDAYLGKFPDGRYAAQAAAARHALPADGL